MRAGEVLRMCWLLQREFLVIGCAGAFDYSGAFGITAFGRAKEKKPRKLNAKGE